MIQNYLPYSVIQAQANLAVGIAGALSAAAVLIYVTCVCVGAYRSWRAKEPVILMSKIGAYLMSLLLADLVKSANFIMDIRWYLKRSVTFGEYCQAQGAMKMLGNLGTALWSLVIAINMFNTLFRRWDATAKIIYVVQIGTWCLVFALTLVGPAALQTVKDGPFFGIAGHGCWITENYPMSRVGLEYVWMFGSAVISFVLYILIFLRLRGNIYEADGKIHWRLLDKNQKWRLDLSREAIDIQVFRLVKLLIWYPVLYFCLMLPMAISRLIEMMNPDNDETFLASIITSTSYALSGFFTVILFTIIRRYIPRQGMLLPRYAIERKEMTDDQTAGVTPYILPPPSRTVTREPSSRRYGPTARGLAGVGAAVGGIGGAHFASAGGAVGGVTFINPNGVAYGAGGPSGMGGIAYDTPTLFLKAGKTDMVGMSDDGRTISMIEGTLSAVDEKSTNVSHLVSPYSDDTLDGHGRGGRRGSMGSFDIPDTADLLDTPTQGKRRSFMDRLTASLNLTPTPRAAEGRDGPGVARASAVHSEWSSPPSPLIMDAEVRTVTSIGSIHGRSASTGSTSGPAVKHYDYV